MTLDIATITEAIDFVSTAASKGATTRADLVTSASQMSSAIALSSTYCIARLGLARAETDPSKKRAILAALAQSELIELSRLNSLCDAIAVAGNQLTHALTKEWMNVNLGKHAVVRGAFAALQQGEAGLQQLFATTIIPPANTDIDRWIDDTTVKLAELTRSASSAVITLTRSA